MGSAAKAGSGAAAKGRIWGAIEVSFRAGSLREMRRDLFLFVMKVQISKSKVQNGGIPIRHGDGRFIAMLSGIIVYDVTAYNGFSYDCGSERFQVIPPGIVK